MSAKRSKVSGQLATAEIITMLRGLLDRVEALASPKQAASTCCTACAGVGRAIGECADCGGTGKTTTVA